MNNENEIEISRSEMEKKMARAPTNLTMFYDAKLVQALGTPLEKDTYLLGNIIIRTKHDKIVETYFALASLIEHPNLLEV